MSHEVRKKACTELVAALKACANRKALQDGSRIHVEVLKRGLLERDIYVGNALVSLYAKCGAVGRAREVFDQLQARDVVSWTVLMAGYTHDGCSQDSLTCFVRMQTESLPPDAFTFVCTLKACGHVGVLDMGQRMHAVISSSMANLLGSDPFISTALLDMYAKCGALAKAHQVFELLQHHNVVSWNAVISGHAQQGEGHRALNLYRQMRYEGVTPDATTLVCALKACASACVMDVGLRVHDAVIREGTLEGNVFIGNALVGMYVKCGAQAEATEAFRDLPVRNVVTWSTLMAGHVENGECEEAFSLFRRMQAEEGIVPDEVCFVCVLKACGNMGAADKGEAIHEEMDRMGVPADKVSVGNALVGMYAKCGMFERARRIFDGLPNPDSISWSIMIAGYVHHEHGEEALDCFEEMQRQGFSADAVTYASVLRACGHLRALRNGLEIHGEIIMREGILAKDASLSIALIDMYAKCGALPEAEKVFGEAEIQNIVTWSALIAGCTENEGHGERAVSCLERLRQESLSPDAVTFVCAMKACGNVGAARKGKELHVEMKERQLFDGDAAVGNALLDMYSKCGLLHEAKKVFDQLPLRSVISWNTLITGYLRHGHSIDALNCFDQMQGEGFSASAITYACALKACGSIGATEKGVQIHGDILREGILQSDGRIGNALVGMYARCGLVEEARQLVLDELAGHQDVVTWNSLISGLNEQGREKEAMECLERMQSAGMLPDGGSYGSILRACGSGGWANKGKETHARMKGGELEKDAMVGNALVSMYGKCGMAARAQAVFAELSARDASSWTSLITAYSQMRRDDMVVALFHRMVAEDDILPDSLAFTVLLNACSHLGLVDQGLEVYASMSTHLGITPCLEHHACLVDLFARAGQFDQAMTLWQRMPALDYLPIWSSLLGAGGASRARDLECEGLGWNPFCGWLLCTVVSGSVE